MGMTMTQKILAAHAGLDFVEPGQLIEAKLDLVLGNDITSPVAINEFEKCGADSVFDKSQQIRVGGIAEALEFFSHCGTSATSSSCHGRRGRGA